MMAADALAALRAQAAARFPLHEIEVPIEGRAAPLRVTLPADPDGPFDQLSAAINAPTSPSEPTGSDAASAANANIYAGLRMPYWAVIWPSGVALAEAALAQPEALADKRVLELGCGLGLTACAALEAGARLTVADCFEDALLFARLNTLANTGSEPAVMQVDWRTHAGREALLAAEPYDVVLGADVLYEDDDVAILLDLLPRLVAPGTGTAWIAEPGRIASGKFVRLATATDWDEISTAVSRVWPTEARPITVTIHRYRWGV
jgi:predicted nicotinamide N-methyase